MTCRESHEYLYAFLDGELDAALSIELQRHLDHCPQCAREAEVERAVRRTLNDQLASSDGAAAEAALRRALASDDVRRGPPRMSRGLTFSGIAAALLILTASAWFGVRGGAGHEQAAFGDLLVVDFERFVEEGKSLELVSNDPQTVSAWLREHAHVDAGLAVSSPQRYELIGARLCKLDGRRAAFALYEIYGRPASVVVLHGTDADLRGMRAATAHGRAHWVYHCRDCTVVAYLSGGVVYAAVGPHSRDDLLALLGIASTT